MPAKSSLQDFMRMVRPDWVTGCWNWGGSTDRLGYGKCRGPNGIGLAHRASFFFHYGPIEKGLSVLHSCDNPSCVNPAHLRQGTHQENMRDRSDRGRSRGGSLKGELHPRRKLSHRAVLNIRDLYLGGMSQKKIAVLFDISQPTVSKICRRKTWE